MVIRLVLSCSTKTCLSTILARKTQTSMVYNTTVLYDTDGINKCQETVDHYVYFHLLRQSVQVVYGKESTPFNNLWLHCSISEPILAPFQATHHPQTKSNHTSRNCCLVKMSIATVYSLIIVHSSTLEYK